LQQYFLVAWHTGFYRTNSVRFSKLMRLSMGIFGALR
jgi:hypothetical protein